MPVIEATDFPQLAGEDQLPVYRADVRADRPEE
jgi:hypothetical protein